ncbi:Mgrn1 [Symbiodinium sp. CCMP2592]|nr:Mgrn1 [Symbiodinium sp. CCMP2592]
MAWAPESELLQSLEDALNAGVSEGVRNACASWAAHQEAVEIPRSPEMTKQLMSAAGLRRLMAFAVDAAKSKDVGDSYVLSATILHLSGRVWAKEALTIILQGLQPILTALINNFLAEAEAESVDVVDGIQQGVAVQNYCGAAMQLLDCRPCPSVASAVLVADCFMPGRTPDLFPLLLSAVAAAGREPKPGKSSESEAAKEKCHALLRYARLQASRAAAELLACALQDATDMCKECGERDIFTSSVRMQFAEVLLFGPEDPKLQEPLLELLWRSFRRVRPLEEGRGAKPVPDIVQRLIQVAGKQACKNLQATAPKDFAENRQCLLKEFSMSVDPSRLGPASCAVQWGNLHASAAQVTFTRMSMTIEVRAGQSFELPWGCLELPEVLLPGQSQPSQPSWPITFSVDMTAACILCAMPGGMSREVGSLEEPLKITPSLASFAQAPSKDFLGSLQRLLHTPPSFRQPQETKERKASKANRDASKEKSQEASYTRRVTRSMSVAASSLASVAKKAMEATIPARRSRSAPGCPKPPTTPVANVASPARGASLRKSAVQPQTSPSSSQDASKQAKEAARNARSRSPVPAQQAGKSKLPAQAGATSPASSHESLKTADAGEKNPKQKPQKPKPQQKKDSRATPKSSTPPPPRRRSPSPAMRNQGQSAPDEAKDTAGAEAAPYTPPMMDPMPSQQDATKNPKPPASTRARSPGHSLESKQGKGGQKKQKQTSPKSNAKVRMPSTSLPPPRRRSPSPSTQAQKASSAADTMQQAATPPAPSKGGKDAQDSQQKAGASTAATCSTKLRTPSSSLPPRRRSPSPSTSKQGRPEPSDTAPPEEQQRSEVTGDVTAPTKFSCLAEAASAALARRSPSPAMQRLAEKVAVNSESTLRARSRSPLPKWQGAAEENSKAPEPGTSRPGRLFRLLSAAPTLSQLGSEEHRDQPRPEQKPAAKRASGDTPIPAARRSASPMPAQAMPSPAAPKEKDARAKSRMRSPLPASAQNSQGDNSAKIAHKGIAALLQATQALPKAASEKATEHRWAQPPKRELLSPGRSPTPRRSVSLSPRRFHLSDASHVASEAADLGIMHPESLRKLCIERGLSSMGLRQQLISRLLIQSMSKKFEDRESIRSGTTSPTFAPFNALHKSELQAACSRQGLPSSGSCNDLLYRLREQRQEREQTSENSSRPARGLSVPPTTQARPVPLSPAPARSFSTPRHRIRSKSPAPAAWTTPARRIRGKSLDPARSLPRRTDASKPVPSESLARPSPKPPRSRSCLAARGGAMVHSLLTLRPEQLASECKKMCLSPQGSPHAMACRLAAARLQTASPGSSATELVSQHSPGSGQLPKPILRRGRSASVTRQTPSKPKAMKAQAQTPSRATPKRRTRSQTRSPPRSRSHARSLLCALPGAKRSDSPPSTPPRRSAPRSPVPSTGSKLPREMRSPSRTKSVGKAGKALSTRSRTPVRTTPARTPHRFGGGCHANTKAGLPCQRSGKIRPAQALFYYCHMHAPQWKIHER